MRFGVGAHPDLRDRRGHGGEVDEEVEGARIPAGRGSGVAGRDEDRVDPGVSEAIEDLFEFGSSLHHAGCDVGDGRVSEGLELLGGGEGRFELSPVDAVTVMVLPGRRAR